MKNSLLMRRATELQNEYRDLLQALMPILKSDAPWPALDSIIIFWKRNSRVVEMLFRYYYSWNDSYVYTGVCYLDYHNNNQYPFLLLGKNHILDDPLVAYADIVFKNKNEVWTKTFLSQIIIASENNLEILNNCKGRIMILPLRLLSQSFSDVVYSVGESLFFSLFNDITDLDGLYRLETIEEIESHLIPNANAIICFSEHDSPSVSLKDRFEEAALAYSDTFYSECAGEEFYFLVYSSLLQAVDIVLSCLEYECTPFLINFKVLFYCSTVIDNITEYEQIKDIIKMKMHLAYAVMRHANKEKLHASGYDVFLEKSENFENLLNLAMKRKGISQKSIQTSEYKTAVLAVKESLEDLYKIL